ncbi:MAG: hypothetical protein ACAI35_28390 [Candidatus Methylacidiphilales bacterium]|nr:hypothetical protein [Candidatus Methylacidiphilales bacterium]
MDENSLKAIIEYGFALTILLILGGSWLLSLWAASESRRPDIVVGLCILACLVLIVWRLSAPQLSFIAFFQHILRGVIRLFSGGGIVAGGHSLGVMAFLIICVLLFLMALSLAVMRFASNRAEASVLISLDASRGRDYDQLREAVVAADGVIVENTAIRRGRLEKAEFVCEDGTRYPLEGALLSHNPTRLILPDGRTLRIGLKKVPVDARLASLTGRVRVPPPLPARFTQPSVDMSRYEDDMQW